jgi:hypothetical protein
MFVGDFFEFERLIEKEMTKVKYFFATLALIAMVLFVGSCEPKEAADFIAIGNSDLTQEVFADQTQGTSVINLSTSGALPVHRSFKVFYTPIQTRFHTGFLRWFIR